MHHLLRFFSIVETALEWHAMRHIGIPGFGNWRESDW